MKKKLPQGDALTKRAENLGVSLHATVNGTGQDDAILQERVMAAEKHEREHRLWIIALISAIASLISALAAWCAILYK